MTENEFKLCCIVFYDNFKGKNLQDVMPPTDSWKPVDVVIDSVVFNETYDFLRFTNSFSTDCIAVLYEKKLIIQELRKYGIYSLYTLPENLNIEVINKYLEIKARGIL